MIPTYSQADTIFIFTINNVFNHDDVCYVGEAIKDDHFAAVLVSFSSLFPLFFIISLKGRSLVGQKNKSKWITLHLLHKNYTFPLVSLHAAAAAALCPCMHVIISHISIVCWESFVDVFNHIYSTTRFLLLKKSSFPIHFFFTLLLQVVSLKSKFPSAKKTWLNINHLWLYQRFIISDLVL